MLEPLPLPASDVPAWQTLQRTPLYASAFPDLTGCRSPVELTTPNEMKSYTTQDLACVQAAWKPILASHGLPTATVPHYYFDREDSTSPCGTVTGSGAFYCSFNGGSIYFGTGLLEDANHNPMWAKKTVGHEYGHHLQGINGFWDSRIALGDTNELTRRIEIQAECIGYATVRRSDNIPWDREMYDRLEPAMRNIIEDGIHGSPDSLAYWGMRGFHGDLVGDCNTWVVTDDRVR